MHESFRSIVTVSQLTFLIRSRLEEEFPDIWVQGEISNLRTPASGHLYFTLKDEISQIRAVLFRSEAQHLRFALREGLQIIVHGRITVYESRGDYQAVLDYLEPKGIGALQLAFEQLKERLAREGLFNRTRKRPLPLLPRRVGLVTSLSGAAIRDMLSLLRRRCPLLDIVIAPVPVQGEGAAPQIAHAIRELGRLGDVDVIIVGRGGGSIEDLWCFNEEVVVRAIASSAIPVVSAIGHEIDYTLSDFAADYRAPTPSAAAEAVAPMLDDLLRMVRLLGERQERSVRARLVSIQHRLTRHCDTLPVFMFQIHRRLQALHQTLDRLAESCRRRLLLWRRRTMQIQQDLALHPPLIRIRSGLAIVPHLFKRIEQQILTVLGTRRQVVRALIGSLDNLSPMEILARGYSIVQRISDHRIIKRSSDVAVGDEILVRLAEGHLVADIRDVLPGSHA